MKSSRSIFPLLISASLLFSALGSAQEPTEDAIRHKESERDDRISKLSTEEQLKLRAAQVRAAEDPEVKSAAEKRNQAVRQFRAAMRASMMKSDPTISAILDKIDSR